MNREQLEQAEKETRAAYERAQEQINRFDPQIIAGEQRNPTPDDLKEYDGLMQQRDAANSLWERTRAALDERRTIRSRVERPRLRDGNPSTVRPDRDRRVCSNAAEPLADEVSVRVERPGLPLACGQHHLQRQSAVLEEDGIGQHGTGQGRLEIGDARVGAPQTHCQTGAVGTDTSRCARFVDGVLSAHDNGVLSEWQGQRCWRGTQHLAIHQNVSPGRHAGDLQQRRLRRRNVRCG
jgi:hypothetical protein